MLTAEKAREMCFNRTTKLENSKELKNEIAKIEEFVKECCYTTGWRVITQFIYNKDILLLKALQNHFEKAGLSVKTITHADCNAITLGW